MLNCRNCCLQALPTPTGPRRAVKGNAVSARASETVGVAISVSKNPDAFSIAATDCMNNINDNGSAASEDAADGILCLKVMLHKNIVGHIRNI